MSVSFILKKLFNIHSNSREGIRGPIEIFLHIYIAILKITPTEAPNEKS